MAAAVSALVVGCGAPSARDPTPTSLAAKCGETHGVHARPRWLHARDGQRLYAIDAGSGGTGVVLVPESPPGSVCGWLPYIATLERAGLRVVSLDYRGTGDSPVRPGLDPSAYGKDLDAAVEQLRREGAKTVILVGASFGGAAAMAYGPALAVDGVISLSGETSLPEYHVDAIQAVPGLRVPLLIVGTRHDAYLSVADAKRILGRAGSDDKQTMFFPGAWHGWEIVEDAPFARTARARILTWIRSRETAG